MDKEKTMPFGVSVMKSQVLYQAAQGLRGILHVWPIIVLPAGKTCLDLVMVPSCSCNALQYQDGLLCARRIMTKLHTQR